MGEQRETAQRGVGLGVALAVSGAAVAIVVTGTAYGLWTTIWVAVVSAWPH
ncbi:hypothetical protein [Curtobacterium sp. MCSS17_008]|uniref:hypothetical protein n=1 Tax=Curtobacterium sp. MCSS17_008 TaxID=2175647 RepID=UPI0015E8B9D4|nr:hypothetical protein [Curtobacterium sp. MCSS17_008]